MGVYVNGQTYAGEGTVVPEVTLVGEAVADEAQLALLGVLLNGVEELLLGDLGSIESQSVRTIDRTLDRRNAYLLLGVGPARNLDDHVQDGLLLVGVEGNVVEGRDGDAILLDVDTVLQRVRLSDLADSVRHFGG